MLNNDTEALFLIKGTFMKKNMLFLCLFALISITIPSSLNHAFFEDDDELEWKPYEDWKKKSPDLYYYDKKRKIWIDIQPGQEEYYRNLRKKEAEERKKSFYQKTKDWFSGKSKK